MQAIHKRVIDEGAPLSAVARQYRDAVFPLDEGQKRDRDVAGLKNVASRSARLARRDSGRPAQIVERSCGFTRPAAFCDCRQR